MEMFQNRSEYDKICIQIYNYDLQNKRVDKEHKYFNRVISKEKREEMNKQFMSLNPYEFSHGCN